MTNMFSGKNEKPIPHTLYECTQQDATATNLHIWAEKLENWGKVLFVILIIIGIFSTIVTTAEMYGIDKDATATTCITSLLTWGLYAYIEYCIYHVLALLISALASITQNTIITANVALFEASKNAKELETARKTNPDPKITASSSRVINSTPVPDGMWSCSKCGTHNKNQYGQCKLCGEYRS